VEVKFNEWTREGRLRQSSFIGVREDKEARDVIREPSAAPEDVAAESASAGKEAAGAELSGATKPRRTTRRQPDGVGPVVERLRAIQDDDGEGQLELGAGGKLQVTSLTKVFYPKTGHTKGDLF